MKKFKNIIIILICGLICGLIYFFCFKPETGTFNELVLSEFSKNEFLNSNIRIDYKCNDEFKTSTLENEDKVNEFISYISELNLKEYKNQRPNISNSPYYIHIWKKDDYKAIDVDILNEKYIEVYNKASKGSSKSKIYEITNKKLKLEYIETVLQICN